MAFVQPYTNLNPRRPRRQPTSVVRTDQPSKIYAAALREVLAWENSSDEGEADGAPPRDDSVSSYVDAWVGAWLRETRADVASSPRGAGREVRGGCHIKNLAIASWSATTSSEVRHTLR